ncbi:MAG TPA: hypothetical protein VK324_05050 [Tepidisphaeraceae bacterium]|nr:hypothetical protein [Tepidisphaeraceae bacterium]
MTGDRGTFPHGGSPRTGWWRWPLAWLVATGLFVGVLVVSWLAWQRPTDLLTLGQPPSMRIVRAYNGRLFFIRFQCTDPNSPAAMRPELVHYRREFLRPRPMDWYPRLGESRDLIVQGGEGSASLTSSGMSTLLASAPSQSPCL